MTVLSQKMLAVFTQAAEAGKAGKTTAAMIRPPKDMAPHLEQPRAITQPHFKRRPLRAVKLILNIWLIHITCR